MPCWIYILHSASLDRYYTGVSDDPDRRLIYHNTRERGYTSRGRPWEKAWSQRFATREEALAAERKVKGWKSRAVIEKLIRGDIRL